MERIYAADAPRGYIINMGSARPVRTSRAAPSPSNIRRKTHPLSEPTRPRRTFLSDGMRRNLTLPLRVPKY